MRNLYFILLLISALLSGCAGQPAQAKTIEDHQVATDPLVSPEWTVAPRTEAFSSIPPQDCPITVPQEPPFIAPAPYSPESPFAEDFWYGTNSLWTLLPRSGVWASLLYDGKGYGQKVFWWREGYVWDEEPEPAITVTAERLDVPAPTFSASGGTNAYADDIGSAMLTGVGFPTLGCWEVTGHYREAELSFVVWIAP